MVSKKLQQIIENDKRYLFQNYGDKLPVCFVKGDGSYLFDQNNRMYVDFFSGIAVSSLGYSNHSLSEALHKQIDNIIHSSNWFYNKEQVEAAKLLSELSFPGKTLFVNSGTEANEAALKLARRYGQSISNDRFHVVSFKGSFHGRTFGSLSATAQEKVREGFGPILSGFKFSSLNDIHGIKNVLVENENNCAIMIELIQGEGGINVPDKKFIKELFKICNENNILTIVDEIQTGIGRTGKAFAYQHFNIKPDILTLAKGLGGGIPIGAIHTSEKLSGYLEKGTHGTTFGGNHLACAAAVVVLKELKKDKLFNNIEKNSNYIFDRLNNIKKRVNFINDIRGKGLLIGVELYKPGMDIVKKALQRGLVINCTSEKVLRIMPPLTIPYKAVKEGMNILEEVLISESL